MGSEVLPLGTFEVELSRKSASWTFLPVVMNRRVVSGTLYTN
ncbi:hypothetical protein P8C59_001149 [Phyllachora maydis]|uniref:Uncharacterized protein n=1 Tax=Phyllachora maydis TaxID=1825666 RepID=A0AAD9HZ44_9PEZI|nr:hypothetical protein P8C59_001149 [Phyllachora maydis]